MAIPDIPILSMLRTRMQWHQERQRVLAENVANADTPNYRARDLAAPNFAGALQAAKGVAHHGADRSRAYRGGRRRLALR